MNDQRSNRLTTEEFIHRIRHGLKLIATTHLALYHDDEAKSTAYWNEYTALYLQALDEDWTPLAAGTTELDATIARANMVVHYTAIAALQLLQDLTNQLSEAKQETPTDEPDEEEADEITNAIAMKDAELAASADYLDLQQRFQTIVDEQEHPD